MKGFIRLFQILIIFLLVQVLVGPRTSVLASGIPNGGFESMPAGGANDWTWPGGSWIWDGSTAHSGSHSISVSRTSGSESGSVSSADIPVSPNYNYTLSFWLRTANASLYPRVILSQYTSTKVQTGVSLTAYANINTGTNDWSLVSYRFQTAPNAALLKIRIYVYTDTIGTFWFDDFSLNQDAAARFPFMKGFPIMASGWDWLSSPIVVDINHDGRKELLIGAGTVINGWNSSGAVLPGFPLKTGDRSIVGQVSAADLDGDGRLEIIAGARSNTATGPCHVFIWHDNGTPFPGWPKDVVCTNPLSNQNNWVTSAVPADINGDHKYEIIASTTNNVARPPWPTNTDFPNLYAFHTDGSLVSGHWPNWDKWAAIYGTVATGDLNGDGKAEVVVGRDYVYLYVYDGNGNLLPGWPIQTYVNQNGGNYDTELRIEFGVSAPTIADLNGDGTPEIIITGHVKGPGELPDVKLTSGLLVLEPDGTRFPGWEKAAVGNGILTQTELPWQEPAVADLNGDGKLEIVNATEDGWIRAYKADKTVLWSMNFTQGGMVYPTEPVIGDIDGDGQVEVVFGTYVPLVRDQDRNGLVGLWALKADGSVEPGFPLAIPTPGMRSAPTLADLNGDNRLEILAATRTGQMFVWSTSAPYNSALMPWPMGRYDLQRSASVPAGAKGLFSSQLSSDTLYASGGETATVTVQISSKEPYSEGVSMTDTLPDGLTFVPGTLSSSWGTVSEANGTISWNGVFSDPLSVEITFQVYIASQKPEWITNSAIVLTPDNAPLVSSAKILINGFQMFIPMIQ